MRRFLVPAVVAVAGLLATASPAAANFKCDGTFAGNNVDGDLVVPSGATCTVSNATVEDDVEVLSNGVFQATDTTVGDDVQIHRDAFGQLTNTDVGDSVNGRAAVTVFVDSGSTVGSEVRTRDTLQVFVFNSTVTEQIDVHDTPAELAGRINICGNTVGRIHVKDSGSDILIGNPDPTVECPGNTVQNGHDLEVENNFTDVEFVVGANTLLGGDLEVSDNSGPALKSVLSNTGSDELECEGNEDPFEVSGNTGWNELEGQCGGSVASVGASAADAVP